MKNHWGRLTVAYLIACFVALFAAGVLLVGLKATLSALIDTPVRVAIVGPLVPFGFVANLLDHRDLAPSTIGFIALVITFATVYWLLPRLASKRG